MVFLKEGHNGSLLSLLLLKRRLEAVWIRAKCCSFKKPAPRLCMSPFCWRRRGWRGCRNQRIPKLPWSCTADSCPQHRAETYQLCPSEKTRLFAPCQLYWCKAPTQLLGHELLSLQGSLLLGVDVSAPLLSAPGSLMWQAPRHIHRHVS